MIINTLQTRLQTLEADLVEQRKDVATYKQEIAKRVEAEMRLQKSVIERMYMGGCIWTNGGGC